MEITFFLRPGAGLVGGGAPASPADLDDLPAAAQVLQPLVDPWAAHAGLFHQVGHRDAFSGGERQGGPQHHVWGAPRFDLGRPGAVAVFCVVPGSRAARGRSWAFFRRAPGDVIKDGRGVGVLSGRVGDGLDVDLAEAVRKKVQINDKRFPAQ